MAPVLAFVDDLMFLSRIQEAAQGQGVEVRSARRLPDLLAACRPAPRVIFMDLDSPRLTPADALAALQADPELKAIPVVGFVRHTEAERARAAQEQGCTRVLARSAFVQELPRLVIAPPSVPAR